MTALTFPSAKPEHIRTTARRLGISLGEASRLRSLEIVRKRASQVEAAYSLLLLSLIVFGIAFAVAAQV